MEQINNIMFLVKLVESAKLRIWDYIASASGWLAAQKGLKNPTP